MIKVRLLRDSRINHCAGEIVSVSPVTADFLISVGSAAPLVETATIPVEDVAEKAVKAPKATTKTTTRKTTKK